MAASIDRAHRIKNQWPTPRRSLRGRAVPPLPPTSKTSSSTRLCGLIAASKMLSSPRLHQRFQPQLAAPPMTLPIAPRLVLAPKLAPPAAKLQ